ncbi:MAG: NAD(P)/FAD-dependent oxidoreductase [Desulfobacterales bacterium]|jgi:phytoene dehydrogenase-like protein
MKLTDAEVVVVGAGLAGLSCARHLMKKNVSFVVLEADERIGGRLKTDVLDGFLLNHGFQVLQTAYPEARRQLDYHRLELKPFVPGAIIRAAGKFMRVSDPRRRPRDIWSSLTAPVGTFTDRLRMIRIASSARRGTISNLFQNPDMTTLEYLQSQGISEKMIERFFKPFFGGVCLDPAIGASSNVFKYVLRVFAEGDVALPGQGMGAIASQLAEDLPEEMIRTGARVESIHPGGAVLTSGQTLKCRAVVLATDGSETLRLLGKPASMNSHGELCLYFAAPKAPINDPYLILNGEGTGVINSLTVPSVVASSYAPAGEALISVVLIGHLALDDTTAESLVRKELTEWFGSMVEKWRHLKTYRIPHALPAQPPPMPDPTGPSKPVKPGIYVCGEYQSVPGIQWALLSGRHAAEAVIKDLAQTTESISTTQQ